MMPLETLTDLLARVGALNGGMVLISGAELTTWPADAVAALQSQRLLTQAREADSVVCPGCEQACVMPVNAVSASGREPRRLVVCDKRSDVGRVPITPDQLVQWRCDGEAVAGWLAVQLDVRRSSRRPDHAHLIEIGMVAGRRRHQVVCLSVESELSLVAGSGGELLSEYVRYKDGHYSIDRTLVQQLVDSSTTSDPRYTPNRAKLEARKLETGERHRKWQRAFQKLRGQFPNRPDVWYAQKIAKSADADGRSAETIRRNMK